MNMGLRCGSILALGLAAITIAAPALAQAPVDPTRRTVFDGLPADSRARYEAAAIRLWEGAAPDATGDTAADVPVLYPVLPAAKGTARGVVLVLPGGGYRYHSAAEAFPIAEHYRDAGMAAFVVLYRLAPYNPMTTALADAQRAVRLIRARAAEFNVDPQKIAAIGFSAGGHLAAHMSVRGADGTASATDPVERESCRIQTALLVYPGILGPGEMPRPDRSVANLVAAQGLHRLVDAQTPPAFLIVGYDDTRARYENTLAYAARLHEAGVRFELHILGRGDHGASVRVERRATWTDLALDWLRARGVAPAAP